MYRSFSYSSYEYESLTSLLVAVNHGAVDVVKLLLAHGADIYFYYKLGRNAFDYAFDCLLKNPKSTEYTEIVRILIDISKADVTRPNSNLKSKSWLHKACCVGALGAVKLLLDSGADTNAVNREGETPLSAACIKNRGNIVETLLEFGVNPNFMCAQMPLHAACQAQDAHYVDMLLAAGANPDVYQKPKMTGHVHTLTAGDRQMERSALCIASAIRNIDAIKSLLKHGANVNVTNADGATAMHCVIQNIVRYTCSALVKSPHGCD